MDKETNFIFFHGPYKFVGVTGSKQPISTEICIVSCGKCSERKEAGPQKTVGLSSGKKDAPSEEGTLKLR